MKDHIRNVVLNCHQIDLLVIRFWSLGGGGSYCKGGYKDVQPR